MDKFIIAKVKTGSNSIILALCTISDGLLSMYQVSFDSLLYFQRYALNKFNIAKIRKGNNSINTGDRVMVIAFYTFPHSSLPLFKFHLFIFNTFRDMLRTSLLLQKLRRVIT